MPSEFDRKGIPKDEWEIRFDGYVMSQLQINRGGWSSTFASSQGFI